MPGIADAGNSLGRIDPSSLIGQSVPVEPRAVSQLTDAFRSGAITAEDIQDRVGELGQAKRKAEIAVAQRQAAELNDPALQEARKQAMLAAGAQGQLATAQANAQASLVPQMTQLQAGQLAQGVSEMRSGIPSATVRDLSFKYGLGAKFDDNGVLSNPDEVLPAASNIARTMNQMQLGQEFAKRVKTLDVKHPDGSTSKVPAWEGTNRLLSEPEKNFLNQFNGIPSALVQPNAQGQQGQQQQGLVQPKTTQNSTRLDADGNPITDERQTADIVKQGVDIANAARAQSPIKDWKEAISFYGNAKDAMDTINKMPLEEQNKGSANLNQRDSELAEAVIKLLDPQGAVREFKWDKFADGQPVVEQLHSVMARLSGSAKFTPGVRQELMKVANGAMRSREESALSALKGASESGGLLNETKEKQLLNGDGTPQYTPPGATSSPGHVGANTGIKTKNGTLVVGQKYFDTSQGNRAYIVTGIGADGKPITSWTQ